MATLFARIRFVAGALALTFMIAMTAPAPAQQPTSVNPNASAVKEQQLLDQLKTIQGLGTIPDKKSYVLEHPAGRDWREFHNVTLHWIGGIAILGAIALAVIFYLWRGSIKLRSGFSGTTILRFNTFERFVHWLTAVSFIILGISGLNITFGRSLLLPWMGAEAFSTWSEWAKYSHNYLSFAFTIGVILMFLMWVGENFPTAADGEWLSEGGGMFDKEDKTHPPAWKFNAGQKILYWLVIFSSVAMMISGFILMFPFYGGLSVGGMQLAEVFHGVIAMLFIALILGHIYIGTIGMEGAFDAMSDGNVDLNWAKEHHSLWVEEEMGSGRARARGAMRPAE
ncbi:MAG TPA: formate dehydrogenase subunit gamma [Pseudolabrys sp.]|nr:formate dehydrogenase subunit gamma [Pseudolabrys sp.]